jgi:hypothetical protein
VKIPVRVSFNPSFRSVETLKNNSKNECIPMFEDGQVIYTRGPLSGNLIKVDHLEYLGLDRRIIIKWILNK